MASQGYLFSCFAPLPIRASPPLPLLQWRSIPFSATRSGGFHGGQSLRVVKASVDAGSSGVDPKAGVAVYKPKSYEVLVSDAARSLVFAIEDGKTRLEIDFP